jgi:hypothetical protein
MWCGRGRCLVGVRGWKVAMYTGSKFGKVAIGEIQIIQMNVFKRIDNGPPDIINVAPSIFACMFITSLEERERRLRKK